MPDTSQPSWLALFIAALQTLTAASPAIIAQFHGGALNTATKVGSALAVANLITSNMAAQAHPATGLDHVDVHPELAAHAASIQAANPDTAV